MPQLFEKAIVEKRNVLNELRSNNMSLQELRFFSIYLSKINPWDISTRAVRFSIGDFQRIMGFGRLNVKQLIESTNSLLGKVVRVPDERGGFLAFTLFKRCRVSKDDNNEWFVEIDASDDALPLMFDFKNKYFKYELWNALRLKSPNQVRMYEILKQYEGIGKRELSITELRELLGIDKDEYSGRTGWSDFRRYVLDSCQQALHETTDICYTYERGKCGPGGKWLTVVFHIEKNKDYVDPLSLTEFLNQQPEPEMAAAAEKSTVREPQTTICDGIFTAAELDQLRAIAETIPTEALPPEELGTIKERRDLLIQQRYRMMLCYDERKPIKNKLLYLSKMLKKDCRETAAKEHKEAEESTSTFDLDEFLELAMKRSLNI